MLYMELAEVRFFGIFESSPIRKDPSNKLFVHVHFIYNRENREQTVV